jgi:hypothetical protein
MEAIRTGEKDGIELQEYKGGYSLVSHREGSDGKMRPQYALYQKGRDAYQEKAWPIKCSIGDRKTAIGVLESLLRELRGEKQEPEPTRQADNRGPAPDEDVPF